VVKALAGIISRLKSQPLLFAIGIGLLLILAFILSVAYSSFDPFYVVVGALLFVFVVAIIADQFESTQRRRTLAQEEPSTLQNSDESQPVDVPNVPASPPENESQPVDVPASPTSLPGNEGSPVDGPTTPTSLPGDEIMPDLMEYLNEWLIHLNDAQFRGLIQLTLTSREQAELTKPVDLINRVEFLNNMKIWRRLEDVRSRLEAQYPDLKPEGWQTL